MSTGPENSTPKQGRRRDVKPSSRADVKRVKLTLYLDADLAKRFSVHAAMTGVDKSELFADLVRAGCKRFRVSDLEKNDPGEMDAA